MTLGPAPSEESPLLEDEVQPPTRGGAVSSEISPPTSPPNPSTVRTEQRDLHPAASQAVENINPFVFNPPFTICDKLIVSCFSSRNGHEFDYIGNNHVFVHS